ncbi:MAG: serine hydrolase domain-containing protein, partial [Hyphococcus sp.]
MNSWTKRDWGLLALGAAGVIVLAGLAIQADRLTRIGAGYKAKIACSEIFVAGRGAGLVVDTEFDGIDPMMQYIKVRVDADRKATSASGPLGLGRARAVYRDGYGCTLANAGRLRPLPPAGPPLAADPWPIATARGGEKLARVDYDAIASALDDAFENAPANHRALVVIVDGTIVGERYADGFSPETRLLSWSMAKSVTATLVGAAAMRGWIDINDPAPVAAWRNDPERARITWSDLLRMQSGLAFEEAYDRPRSDVNRMLFEMADAAARAEQSPAAHAPGEVFAYSSGTTNLLSKLLRQELTARGVDYHGFARQAVFDPIGAASMVMETDAVGNYVGSSFVYASARDWARLGQLYLQDGVWEGRRLLPEGWTA